MGKPHRLIQDGQCSVIKQLHLNGTYSGHVVGKREGPHESSGGRGQSTQSTAAIHDWLRGGGEGGGREEEEEEELVSEIASAGVTRYNKGQKRIDSPGVRTSRSQASPHMLIWWTKMEHVRRGSHRAWVRRPLTRNAGFGLVAVMPLCFPCRCTATCLCSAPAFAPPKPRPSSRLYCISCFTKHHFNPIRSDQGRILNVTYFTGTRKWSERS